MEVCFGSCEIDSFRGSDDANIDVASTGLRYERVEDFVIVDEEMNMQPERIRQDNFRELERPTSKIGIFIRFWDGGLSHQFSQQFEVLLVRVFFSGVMG